MYSFVRNSMRWAMVCGLSLGILAGCSSNDDGEDDPTPTGPDGYPANYVIKTGLFTASQTWDKDSVYVLRGNVIFETPAGAAAPVKLTIEAGTIIKGEATGVLIINGGIEGRPAAQVEAIGTAAAPIVFTSIKAAGQRNYGDWGGVVLIGKSFVNQYTGAGAARPQPEGNIPSYIRYGGSNNLTTSAANTESLGRLSYVRIEFAGIPQSSLPNSEINGLTMYGVGAGTTIDHIQVSFCNDDAFEWFGGNVNAKYLVSFRTADDDFDTDFGYRGNVQFALALRNPARADSDASNGFESDNDANTSTLSPLTRPVFSNVTLIGPRRNEAADFTVGSSNNYNAGMRLRRNSRLNAFNVVIMGYLEGIEVNDATTAANLSAAATADAANTDSMMIRNVLIADVQNSLGGGNANATTFLNAYAATLGITTRLNAGSSKGSGTGIYQDPYNLTAPNFTLAVGSPAATGGSVTLAQARANQMNAITGVTGSALEFTFENVTFLGAIGATNWLATWTNFDPQNTPY